MREKFTGSPQKAKGEPHPRTQGPYRTFLPFGTVPLVEVLRQEPKPSAQSNFRRRIGPWLNLSQTSNLPQLGDFAVGAIIAGPTLNTTHFPIEAPISALEKKTAPLSQAQ